MLENIDNNFKKLLDEISEEKLQKVNFVPGISPIPVSGKVIDKEDIAYLVDSSLDAWFTSGRYTSNLKRVYQNILGLVIVCL